MYIIQWHIEQEEGDNLPWPYSTLTKILYAILMQYAMHSTLHHVTFSFIEHQNLCINCKGVRCPTLFSYGNVHYW